MIRSLSLALLLAATAPLAAQQPATPDLQRRARSTPRGPPPTANATPHASPPNCSPSPRSPPANRSAIS